MTKVLGYAAFVLSIITPSACGVPAAKMAADRNGDLSYRLTDRRRPDAELVASCGDGELTALGETTLKRGPYLQQVKPDSALIAFTSAGEKDVAIDVTRPDGQPVVTTTAVEDTSATPVGAWQGYARLEGLQPSTTYCYALRGLSGRAGFRTAPPADSTAPVRVLAFGDSGTGSSEQYALKRYMLTVPFDLVIHTGDVAYDTGKLWQLETGFFAVYQDIAKSFPVTPISGNHDYATEGAKPFRDVFLLPENGGPDGAERWFSFDWGQVHFVALDTEVMGSAQAAWLERDLAENTKPWTIVYAHKPPFSSGAHGSFGEFRSVFHPILAKYKVPLVLNGHEHDYERVRPQDGITYVVTGGGGRGTRSVGISSFTAFSEDVIHFVQLEIHANELFMHAIDGTGHEFDSLRIAKSG